MTTTMVALVGMQPLPNLIPVRYYCQHHRLDTVLFVYTTGTRNIYDNLQQVLQTDVRVYGVETDPYDITSITKAINDKIEELQVQDNSLIFNLTGGTKPMSLAAYRVAQQRDSQWVYLQSEKKQSLLHRYSWKNLQIEPLPDITLPSTVTLKDFFDLCYGKDTWRPNVQSTPPGSHFENAIAHALRSEHSNVDEILVGVRTNLTNQSGREQIDLDIVARIDDQIGIIEAKSTGKKTLDGVKQLSNAMRVLSTYTRQFYVVAGDYEPLDEQKPIFERLGITVISLPNYKLPEEKLPPDELEKLVTTIRKVLKG